MLHVVLVSAVVSIAGLSAAFSPESLAVLLAIYKLSCVAIAVGPCVLSIAFSFAPLVFAYVNVPTRKNILPLIMSETHLPLALVEIAVLPGVLSKALRLIMKPLSNILILICALPDTIAVLHSLPELPFVFFSVHPGVLAAALHFAHVVFAGVGVAVGEDFGTLPMPLIIKPLPLINPIGIINNSSPSMPIIRSIVYFSFENGVFVLFYAETGAFYCFLPLKELIVEGYVVVD